MGIELPAPSNGTGLQGGEARIAPQNVENSQSLQYGAEQGARQQTVESLTTERPSAQEMRTGQGAGDGFAAPQTSDVPATSVTPAQPAPAASLDDVPVIAADEDLIEKQWVESAKRVITDTRSDPYRQSEAISRLQADYLQKRYGKTLSNGGA